MKLTAALLVLCVALLSHSTMGFWMNWMAKPAAPTVATVPTAVEAGAGAVANSYFKGLNPLRIMLTSLGIPVEHLVEGSRKCVAELSPEAMRAMNSLLVKGAPGISLCTLPSWSAPSPPRGSTLSTPLNPTQGSRPHDRPTSFPSPEKHGSLRWEPDGPFSTAWGCRGMEGVR
ncbi:Secretoglobin family 3A member 1 [Pteropus alecto]|uniref:Secretoglobin family 3A member 1 n=1 Tax=Pteropus alecto TaxID=9402 RepID=L5JV50_PTEAL|nr:Secretoglobin family 3A member 1 [Pteropus alecto]